MEPLPCRHIDISQQEVLQYISNYCRQLRRDLCRQQTLADNVVGATYCMTQELQEQLVLAKSGILGLDTKLHHL